VAIDMAIVEVVTDTTWTLDPLALVWDLPASAEWTHFSFGWTNPAADIGGTLTMMLMSAEGEGADTLTFFDDFTFGVPTGTPGHASDARMITVYPNPASEMIYLKTDRELTSARFFNSLGQQVKTVENPQAQIRISDLPAGIYILRVTDREGMDYKARFIKK
jgi:hypothetical protein